MGRRVNRAGGSSNRPLVAPCASITLTCVACACFGGLQFWKTPATLLGQTVRIHSGVYQNFRTGEGPVKQLVVTRSASRARVDNSLVNVGANRSQTSWRSSSTTGDGR